MTDYEYNAQIERERAEYHKKRSEESQAYKAVYDGFENFRNFCLKQGRQFAAAINGQEYEMEEDEDERNVPLVPLFLIPGYIDALKEFAEAEMKFDSQLIKRNGFEW